METTLSGPAAHATAQRALMTYSNGLKSETNSQQFFFFVATSNFPSK